MVGPEVTGLHIRTEERSFKTLADSILRLVATTEQQALQRAALVNSARTFIEHQIINHGYEPAHGYRPMEYYMTDQELTQPFASLDLYRLKLWLQHNLDVFEKKSKGGLLY